MFVVPDLGVSAYRHGRDFGREDVTVRLDVEASATPRPSTAGHLLPVSRPAMLAGSPDVAAASAAGRLPPKRDFEVYDQDLRRHVNATGSLAYIGARYAFYEDANNQKNFTHDEYATIDARATEDYGTLVDIFGSPPDIDGNGRVIAFVSRTVADHHRAGQAYVDGCNLDASATGCGGTADIIYFWALDGFRDADARRDFYVQHYYPRTLLHETIHLCQHRTMVASGRSRRNEPPPYLYEGQAMLMRFIRPHGDVDWDELSQLVDHLGPHGTPFETPYAMGGLFAWWMHQHYGPSIERTLMEAEADDDVADPVERATGAPEPLVFAQFYAALFLDGTAYGHESGLEFGVEHLRAHMPHVPIEPVHPGETRETTVLATGRAGFEVEHQMPVRLKVEAFPEKAYVFVVQPH